MTKNNLTYYLETQKKSFLYNYNNVIENFDIDTIHDLRVSIKRLNTLYRFVEFIDNEDFKCKDNFKEFRKIFKSLGKIRDYQVTEDLILNDYSQLKNSELILNVFRKKKKKTIKKFTEKQRKFKTKKVNSSFNIAAKVIEKIDDSKINLNHQSFIKQSLDLFLEETRKNLHNARKRIKDIYYLLEIQNIKTNTENTYFNKIKLIASSIGNWHDIIVFEFDLKKITKKKHKKVDFTEIKNQNKNLKQKYLTEFYSLIKEFL